VIDISNKVIGTSLGQCIRDILVGHVKFTDVIMIYCGTNIQSQRDLNKVIDRYSRDVWAFHNEEVIRQVIDYFLFRGLIQQERVGNNIYYGSYPNHTKLWYKLSDFDVKIQKAFTVVFSANLDNSDKGDIPDADKRRNSSVKEELDDLILANAKIYDAKRRRCLND
tara:strand:- start:4272 stop:4769 length:498 start_codon:yes stop_codon:yes gene_type:complete